MACQLLVLDTKLDTPCGGHLAGQARSWQHPRSLAVLAEQRHRQTWGSGIPQGPPLSLEVAAEGVLHSAGAARPP